jgi:Recombination endonuclease VII
MRSKQRTHCKWGHEFTPENTRIDNGRRICKACSVRRVIEWRKRDGSEYTNKYAVQRYWKNREEILAYRREKKGFYQYSKHLLKRYGLSQERYETIWEEQDGKCAGCGKDLMSLPTRNRHVDHDHACCPGKNSCGKCVRGIVCNGCNFCLAWFEKNKQRVEEYLS